jgi:hypothetical protein
VQHLAFSDTTIDVSELAKVAFSNKDAFITLDALYAAYLNRAPDALGIDYWTARFWDGMSFRDIAKSFYVQPEVQGVLPVTGTPDQVVTAAYLAALGRTPDPAGRQYWTDELTSGHFGQDDLILGLIGGALAGANARDRTYVENRATVGGFFALTNGLGNQAWAETVMEGVKETPESFNAAIARTKEYAAKAAAQDSTEFVVKLVGVFVGPLAVGGEPPTG